MDEVILSFLQKSALKDNNTLNFILILLFCLFNRSIEKYELVRRLGVKYRGKCYICGAVETLKEDGIGYRCYNRLNQIKAKLIKERGRICEDCGIVKPKEIHLHHIKPKQEYPELAFNEKNLLLLCKDCHHKIL